MKKRHQFIVTICFLLASLMGLPVQADGKLPSGVSQHEIGKEITAFVDKNKETTAAMETAVFTADTTIYEGYFGYMNKETGLRADEDSVFEWGSITKTVTWISLMQQVEAGKVDLKADIRTYLPKGFLKNLTYDQPVTVLDLMNHQGGFQESVSNLAIESPDQRLPLEDFLRKVQPPQIDAPGTVTAYSNWGTALAAYIVQRVSGEDFADYVRGHIFEPLGMKDSLIRTDRSDNAFVKEQRERNHSYYPTGQLRGRADDYTNDYPAGSIISTLGDLKTYGQALLKQEAGPIFKDKETWKKLFSPSSYYPNSHTARNRHGFWDSHYAVTLTGHPGGMDGYTTNLVLDLKHGIGMVVMTNQQTEQVYNAEMLELVFGQPKRPKAGKLKNRYYVSSARIEHGPLSYLEFLFTNDGQSAIFKNRVLNKFYSIGRLDNGREVVAAGSMDNLAVPSWKIWVNYASLLMFVLAVLYALLHLIYLSSHWLFYKMKGQSSGSGDQWSSLSLGLTLLLGLLGGYFIYQTLLMMMDHRMQGINEQQWLIFIIAFLTPLLVLVLSKTFWGYLQQQRTEPRLTWKMRLHRCLTGLAGLSMIWFIYYWDLYQWWLI